MSARVSTLSAQAGGVQFIRDDKVAVITLNQAPLNPLGHSVRQAIANGMAEAEAKAACQVVVITGNGRAFSAGADITEFGPGKMKEPFLPEVIDRVEQSKKIVVAAINGLAMGGGCELALGCHYRILNEKAIMALPEIKLGLIPGAGGTQRLPRCCGAQFAIQMCCTGGNIKAPVALKNGLVDKVVPVNSNIVSEAADFGLELAAKKVSPRRLCDDTSKLGNRITNYFVFRAARQQVEKNTPKGMISPLRALDAVEAAHTSGTFKQGMAAERKIFFDVAQSTQAGAMQHFFKSERRALKIPGLGDSVKPKPVKSVGIIGGGTMGGGIAMCFMNVGVPVVLIETAEDRKKWCVDTISKNYLVTVEKGKLSKEKYEKRMALLNVVVGDYSALGKVDYVIEAVFENMQLKKEIFAKLERAVRPDCILASNTSTLSVDEIASATSSPHRVIGAHFFSPANVMKLLEFVRGAKTDSSTIVTSLAVGKLIKKAPVMVGNCFGFIANRMVLRGGFSCMSMIEEGALPAQVDKAIKNFGYPIGLFQMQDLAGLDVGSKIRAETPKEFIPKRDVTQIPEALVKQGRHGQKSGKGWYLYNPDKPRVPVHDPAVDKLVIATSAKKKIKRRSFTDEEIIERYIYIMVNEAALILQEGFAYRPSDIDIIFIYGFGFPPYRGGPCHYADIVGIKKVVQAIEKYRKALGEDSFPEPAPLLKEMVANGTNFASLNK